MLFLLVFRCRVQISLAPWALLCTSTALPAQRLLFARAAINFWRWRCYSDGVRSLSVNVALLEGPWIGTEVGKCMRWHRAGDSILTDSCTVCFQACLRAGTRCWAFCPTCCPRGDGVNGSLVRSRWGRNFFAEGDKSRTGHLRGCFGKAVSCGLSKEMEDNTQPRRFTRVFRHPPARPTVLLLHICLLRHPVARRPNPLCASNQALCCNVLPSPASWSPWSWECNSSHVWQGSRTTPAGRDGLFSCGRPPRQRFKPAVTLVVLSVCSLGTATFHPKGNAVSINLSVWAL